jgi:hypothetical protein
MTDTLRKITAEEFARRLKESSEEPDKRFAFFLGAGCSVSSGIPAAGRLVRDRWLPRLKALKSSCQVDLDSWAKELFSGYESENAGDFYGEVIQELFLWPEDRQLEIENLCEGRFPGFGYAALASLIALDV